MAQRDRVGIANPVALMLNRFLRSNEQNTLILRGPWGIGKTHAVERFVEQQDFSSTALVARSSVSLFGKQSIAEIQRDIFSNAVQVATDEVARARLGTAAQNIIKLEKLLARTRFQRLIAWVRAKLGIIEVPWLGSIGSMMAHGNYEFVESFLVIIDDLERRSASVPLKDVLGLIDELVRTRECKVIAVCNEDALNPDDRGLLFEFKEKVFDVDLLFVRSPRDITRIGLPETCGHKSVSEEILVKLGISNIRVVRRYAFLVDQIWDDIATCDARIAREVLEHVAILTWARYDSSAGIPPDKLGYLVSEESWMATALRERNATREHWESAWSAAAEALEFSSEKYDIALVEYMRTGIWVPGSLKEHIEAKAANLEALEAQESLRAAWRMYSDGFNTDQHQFVASLVESIDHYMSLLSPRDVDSAFSVLEDLGVDFSGLADRYKRVASSQIESAALVDWPFGDFRSATLRPVVEAARSRDRTLPTVDSALERIAVQGAWSEEDGLAVNSCSEDDLFEWMMSGAENMPAKVRRGLLEGRVRGDDARQPPLHERAIGALRRIAALNEFNRLRVENIYGVKLDDEG